MTIDVTVTFGVPGSASTWVYNVVRELRLIQHHGKNVESFYSDVVDRVHQVLKDNQHLERKVIWKLHEPEGNWLGFLTENRVPLVMSMRDPRDAMLSLMERFGATREDAFYRVNLAFSRIAESLDHPHAGLRYENRFFDQPETVDALAQYLGVAITAADRDRIFAAYRTDAVKRLANDIDALPAARIQRHSGNHYDEVTQIHHVHIGDQRIGKWRERFDADTRTSLNAQFRPFLAAFGYELD